MMKFLIEEVITGKRIHVDLDLGEISVQSLKAKLSNITSVSMNDQIILLGPPFKLVNVIDFRFQQDDQRIFLFDRKYFSSEAEIMTIKEYDFPLPELGTLMQNSNYLESFLVQQKKLIDLSGKSNYESSKILDELHIMIDGINASVSYIDESSRDFKSYLDSTGSKFHDRIETYSQLLSSFESNLNNLENILVDEELLEFAKLNGVKLSMREELLEKRSQVTMLDLISIDKEKKWINSCQSMHLKMISKYNQLKEDFQKDCEDIDSLRASTLRANGIVDKVNDLSFKICENTNNLKSKVLQISSSQNVDGREDTMLNATEECDKLFSILSMMHATTSDSMSCIIKILYLKNEFQQFICKHMNILSKVDTDIQGKLKMNLTVIKKWYEGRNEYLSRLENLSNICNVYDEFKREMTRRHIYQGLMLEKLNQFTQDMEIFRKYEISKREAFLKEYGAILPQNFFDLVPSLVSKPPYCKVDMTEIPILPEFNLDSSTLQSITDEMDIISCDLLNTSVKNPIVSEFISSFNNICNALELDVSFSMESLSVSNIREGRDKIIQRINNLKKTNKLRGQEYLLSSALIDDTNQLNNEFSNNCNLCESHTAVSDTKNDILHPKLSFHTIEINDVVLFIRKSSSCYIAFNVNCPHRYLSQESLLQMRYPKDFLVGRIQTIDTCIAKSTCNPFGLAIGTEYYILTATYLN